MEYLGAWGTLIHEKNLKSKISCQIPFDVFFKAYLMVPCTHADTIRTAPFSRLYFIGVKKAFYINY